MVYTNSDGLPTFSVLVGGNIAYAVSANTQLRITGTTGYAVIQVSVPETATYVAATEVAVLTVSSVSGGGNPAPRITFLPIEKLTTDANKDRFTPSVIYDPSATAPTPTFSVFDNSGTITQSLYGTNMLNYTHAAGASTTARILVEYIATATHSPAAVFTTMKVTDPALNPPSGGGGGITVSKFEMGGVSSMYIGDSAQFVATVTVLPSTASQGVFWSVNGTAASVSQTGMVKGIRGGTVQVRATLIADHTQYKEVTLEVKIPPSSNGGDGEYMMDMGQRGPYRVFNVPGNRGIWTENIREDPWTYTNNGTAPDGKYGYYYAQGQAVRACQALGNGFRLPTKAECAEMVNFAGTWQGLQTRAFFVNERSMGGFRYASWTVVPSGAPSQQVGMRFWAQEDKERVQADAYIGTGSGLGYTYGNFVQEKDNVTADGYNVRCVKFPN